MLLSASLTMFVYAAPTVSVSGRIRNSFNLEAVPFAVCYIEETEQGVNANERGYYIIPSVVPGDYHLVFHRIGFEILRIAVSLQDSKVINVELQPASVELEGIRVSSSRQRGKVEEFHIPLSEMKINPVHITELPQVAEPDLFRAVQMLPGVTSISDFSSGLYIRGGSPDQNQILLDGIDVYNPSHLMGFFSTFNVDAINTVDLIKGGFDAKYGGRLSSVMNVYNLDGNRNRFDGNVNMSLITSKITLSGPWEKGSWMLSGRRTYLELVDAVMSTDIPDYHFYDGHIKLNYDISPKNYLQYSFFTGRDTFRLQEDPVNIKITWGNITNALRWTHIFSPNFYNDVLIAHSHYGSQFDININEMDLERKNRLYDLTFKTNSSYLPSNEHNIEFGTEIKRYHVVFEASQNEEQVQTEYPEIDHVSLYSALYLMDSWRLNSLLLLKYGLRFEHYQKGNYYRLSPRLSLKYNLSDDLSIYGAWGLYYQYLTLIGDSDNSSFDIWFPLDRSVKPLEADHYIIGGDINWAGVMTLNAEIYYKEMRNLTEFRPEIDYDYDPDKDLAQAFHFGKGYAYGLDLTLNNDWFGLEGFISYSYGRTRRQFAQLNEGLEYHPKFDRRHQITINENYYRQNWVYGLSYTYGSGQPFRKPLGIIEGNSIDGYPVNHVLYGRYDSYRLPSYSRLDVSIRKLFYTKNYLIEPYLQIINILSAKNPNDVFYYRDGDEFKKSTSNNLPLIPSLGVNIKW